MKACSKCNTVTDEYHTDSRARDGLLSKCKPCVYADSIVRKYGITKSEYDTILESQGGSCAMCNEFQNLCVDHCHTTGQVRGILCKRCNFAIGYARDDVTILAAAIKYLENSHD